MLPEQLKRDVTVHGPEVEIAEIRGTQGLDLDRMSLKRRTEGHPGKLIGAIQGY